MMNFCTLFDSGYLQRGLALYESLCKTCEEFHLYIMAFNDKAYDVLTELNLPYLTVVHLKDFEDEKLLEVKPTRTRAEYCWTCGPSVIYYFITKYNLDSCTYLDADLMFFRSPQILFDEIGYNSVAITDHFASYDIPQGRYCVQFMYFKNDEEGMKALKWWRDSCIDWCYARFENGKYGDQKYLEDFPRLFKKVCILKNRGGGLAAWNFGQYSYDAHNLKISYNNELFDIVFVHFHAVSMEVSDRTLIISPATFGIESKYRFLFEQYANLIVRVCNQYLNVVIDQYKINNRGIIKGVIAKLKNKFHNVAPLRYLYDKLFRKEYRGYDKKTIIG